MRRLVAIERALGLREKIEVPRVTWSGRAAENAGLLSDNIVRGLSGDFQKTPLSQTSAVGASRPLTRVLAKVR